MADKRVRWVRRTRDQDDRLRHNTRAGCKRDWIGNKDKNDTQDTDKARPKDTR